MRPTLPHHPLQLQCRLDHRLDRLLLRQIPQLRHLLQRIRQLRPRHFRNQIGNSRCFSKTHSHHPTHIPHRHLGPHRSKGNDLRHRPLPVLVAHIGNHLLPSIGTKIHVDIGRRNPFRIQKSLKEQPIANRTKIGNPQHIGNQTPRRTTPTRPDRNPFLLRIVDKIPNDEEIADKPSLLDHPHLKLQPLLQLLIRSRSLPIPLPQPLLAQFAKISFPRHSLRHRKSRKLISAQFELQITSIRHRQCLLIGSRKICK